MVTVSMCESSSMIDLRRVDTLVAGNRVCWHGGALQSECVRESESERESERVRRRKKSKR